jgi:N-acetylmuramoyl-L-alanine amidase
MLTRDRDVKMSLKERTDKIAAHPVDASVSIHVNSTENPHSNARGVEVYLVPDVNCKSTTGYLPTTGSSVSQDFIIPSTKLAIAVHQRLKMMDSSVVDRGVRHAYFRLVRDVPAPCVLAEIGFINHPEERAQLAKATYRASIARAIADGIEDAFAAYPMSVK